MIHTCEQIDGTTVVCNEVLEGWPFMDRAIGEYVVFSTFTVVDGSITRQVLDWSATETHKYDSSTVIEYQDWIRANQPELEADLFRSFGGLNVTPDNVETHRELMAEWKAQR